MQSSGSRGRDDGFIFGLSLVEQKNNGELTVCFIPPNTTSNGEEHVLAHACTARTHAHMRERMREHVCNVLPDSPVLMFYVNF